MKKLAAAICCLFLLPVLVAGAAMGSGGALAVDPSALEDIPPKYLSLYAEASARHRFDWELLAAVGKVECDHGRGDCYRPNPVGALGPMQFMPATWRAYASASGTPPFDVFDARDAIFAAAAKLSVDGIRRDPRRAVFSYNHSSAYVDEVLSWAARYGWMSGNARSLAGAVLAHPNIELRPDARADIEAGLVDPRVLGALLVLAREHRLGYVGPFVTGHSIYVSGTDRISNHVLGRAVDIPVVDGAPVSASNPAARSAAESLLHLPSPLRPDELGAPWRFSSSSVATFTHDHERHLHFGFSEEVE